MATTDKTTPEAVQQHHPSTLDNSSTENENHETKADVKTNEFAEAGVPEDEAEYKRTEAALVRKLDLYIAPVMMMLMLISYLDRGNIGFAATQGMATDIGLKGNQLNVSPIYRTSRRF